VVESSSSLRGRRRAARRPARRRLTTVTPVLTLVLAACGGPAPQSTDDAAGTSPTLEGGRIELAECGYAVTTRYLASAPVRAADTLGPDPTPKHLHLGLAGPATTSMVVSWRTADDATESTLVQYGKASVAEHEARGLTFIYGSFFGSGDGPPVRMHETHLCGLEPDTVYRYRVGGRDATGREVWSPEHSFRTAPDPQVDPSASVTVLVLGDTRDGYTTFGELLRKGRDLVAPDLLLFTGDAVTLGQLQAEWDAYFDAGEEVLRGIPVIAAHGNHEANAINYYAQLALPGDEENFSIDYGPLHLAVVNDTPEDIGALDTTIPAFLDADLGAARQRGVPWLFTLQHRPLYSASTNHGSDLTLRGLWGPIYDAHHVDVAVTGHDHNYERSLPIRGEQVQASFAEGTMYLVAGSAGVSLYDNGTGYWTATSEKTLNMVAFELRPGLLEMTAYRGDGTVIESLSISKP
jgi:hypothetical protein